MWQLAVQQQLSGFFKAGLLRQFVDGVSPVAQFACLAVDEGGGRAFKVNTLEAAMDFNLLFGRHGANPEVASCQ